MGAERNGRMENDFRGKRLLILGGAVQCLKVVETAREMGVYTIVTDLKADGAAKLSADEALPFSVTDAPAILDWCGKHPVDGVLNYCVDFAQIAHQRVCEALGLPAFGTSEQYRCLTDKAAFKQLCVESGVDVIPEYDENEPEKIEYPVLVKPAESSGSRGASVCSCRAELDEAVKKAKAISRNGKTIIEKYMGGKQDFTVTYLVADGEPYPVRIGDRYLGRVEDGLDRQCICTVSPSRYLDLYFEKVHGSVVGMLKKLGLRNGPVFFQGFVDGDTVRFYDPGIRFPGGEYDRLFREATDVDLVRAVIEYALSGKLPLKEELSDAFLLKGRVAVQVTAAVRAGTIGVYEGFDEVEKLPGVVCAARKSAAGRTIPASGDVKQRGAEIDYLAADRRSAAETAGRIYGALRILDTEGKDMVVSRVSPELLEPSDLTGKA